MGPNHITYEAAGSVSTPAAERKIAVSGVPIGSGPAVAGLDLPTPFPEHLVPEDASPATELMRFVPQIPLAERERRWQGLRKRMLMADVDVLVFLGNDIYWDMGIANIRYMAGMAAKMGSHALFFLDQDPVLYHAVAHMSRPFHISASMQSWVADIRILRGLAELAAELVDRGHARSRIGLVGFTSTIQTSPTFLESEVALFKSALPQASFVDFSYALQEMRMVKSETEIDLMRQGAVISRQVLDTLVELARPGVTEAELYAEMIRTQIALGAEPNIFNLLASGPVEHPTNELWHLLHGSDQPMVPTRRPLAGGDLVITEWHTKYAGYLVHTEYTVYLGRSVPGPLQRIWDVSLECLDASREAMQPGNTLREVWEAVRRPCERASLDFVELGFHAMGLASPEFPTVIYRPGYGSARLDGSRIGDLVLEEGMTFGNNIDLHDPAWKPDVGCMLADFMVVRPGGAELLVGTPRTLGLGAV